MRRALPVQAIGKGDILLAQALCNELECCIDRSFETFLDDPRDVYNEFVTYINKRMHNEFVDEAVISLHVDHNGVPSEVVGSVAAAFRKEGWNVTSDEYFIEIDWN